MICAGVLPYFLPSSANIGSEISLLSPCPKACEGKVVFTTNHFSTYAIVFEDVSPDISPFFIVCKSASGKWARLRSIVTKPRVLAEKST
jgi:hypothetical protein